MVNPLANFNLLDTRIGDRLLNLPAITAIMVGASSAQQQAFIAEIEALMDATPGPVIATELEVDTGTKTATATAGAATLNKQSGKITTENLSTAAQAIYALTLTNSGIVAGDIVLVSVANGTNSAGDPVVETVVAGTHQVVINILNAHATAAFNGGTLVISYVVFKNVEP